MPHETSTAPRPAADPVGEHDAPRIASLIPAGTDLVAALGLEAHLVGVSHACDHPAAEGRPVLTASTLPSASQQAGVVPPDQIDREVVDAVLSGTALYRTDAEGLDRLSPDVVIGQEVCDVCAVDSRDVVAALPAGAELVTLKATSVASLGEDLRVLGRALGREREAEEVSARIAARHERVAERVAGRPRPTVLTLEWSDPPFIGGHWVPELVDIAGGTHPLIGPGEPSARSDWDVIAACDPDVIVAMPCGYGLEATIAESRELLARPEVADLRAVREGRWWATDATALFSRATPAMARAAEVLAGILHDGSLPAPEPHEAVRVTGS